MRGTTANPDIHADESRKQSFDSIAKLYEVFRPGYPQELVELLLDQANLSETARVLEIGCGSGQATKYFVGTPARFTCIDISEALLEIARANFSGHENFDFLNTKFEDLSNREQLFDLVFAAQSFHWIDFLSGIRKCDELLLPGGMVALFWNSSPYFDPTLREKIDRAYLQWQDGQTTQEDLEEKKSELFSKRLETIKSEAIFKSVELHSFSHKINYTAETYIGLLKTHSDHSTRPADELMKLTQEIGNAIVDFGEPVAATYKTRLILCRK